MFLCQQKSYLGHGAKWISTCMYRQIHTMWCMYTNAEPIKSYSGVAYTTALYKHFFVSCSVYLTTTEPNSHNLLWNTLLDPSHSTSTLSYDGQQAFRQQPDTKTTSMWDSQKDGKTWVHSLVNNYMNHTPNDHMVMAVVLTLPQHFKESGEIPRFYAWILSHLTNLRLR